MADQQEFKPVYWIARSVVIPAGAREEDIELSPTTYSIEDARGVLKQIRQHVPNAVILCATRFR